MPPLRPDPPPFPSASSPEMSHLDYEARVAISLDGTGPPILSCVLLGNAATREDLRRA